MKLKFTMLVSAGMLLFLSYLSNAQEKWNIDPRMTQVYATGTYVELPQKNLNFKPFSTQPRMVHTRIGDFQINANVRVHPDAGATQSEVAICRHPLNQAIMFGSANTVWPSGGFSGISEGVYVTTNSGVDWFGWDSVRSPVISGHGGDDGPTIDKNGVFIISHLGYPTSGMFTNYSTDNGSSWSATYTIVSGSMDKNFSGTDDAPSSPYYGRSYTVWSNFSLGSPPVVVSYTTNGGVSWSAMAQVNTPPSGHYSQGTDMRCGPNGEVYIIWAAPTSGGSYTEDFYGFAKSTNGGVTWTVTENAYDGNGIRGYLSGKNSIRVNSFPRIDVDRSGGPRNGWIYTVGCDQNLSPAGSDPDIIMHRSTDGGTTWSSGIRVNQDALNNGKIQYFPAIRVDEMGGINIIYYDDRNVAANQCQVYVSRSVDGGATWTDILVSDHNFAPQPISGLATGYNGDYIGITSGNNKVWPFWCDNSTGANLYQAWTTSIDLGPSISHTPLPNTENTAGPYVVNCVITPAGSTIDPTKTRLLWSRNNASITDSLLLTNTSGNNWTGNIPGNSTPATYRYYLKTVDLLNRTATAPPGAPGSLYSFLAMPDTVKPVITHTPLVDMPRNNWPGTVVCSVTDNIGVDSAWVTWYKNTPSTGLKRFNLNHPSGNVWQNPFNSDTSQVTFNDSIFYRIVARDISTAHNKDSTALYHFKLLAVSNSCVGTGSVSASWPYNTYWWGSRTDMLYTSAELLAGGGSAGFITRIGFNVTSAASQSMNGFNLKLQNTSATTVTGFVNSGWVIGYTGTYTVPGTGWQYIDLQTPFYWDGAQNLLVEICYGNTSWTAASTVNSTAATNMTWTYYQDASTGCTFTGGSSQSRPNICMAINILVGKEPVSTIVPQIYSLSQNYPNPFNPVTTIKYSLPKSSLVKFVVYDVLGKEVVTLVNGMKQAGNYQADFDGTNLASGVYFYRIEAGDFVDVKKMVLLK